MHLSSLTHICLSHMGTLQMLADVSVLLCFFLHVIFSGSAAKKILLFLNLILGSVAAHRKSIDKNFMHVKLS